MISVTNRLVNFDIAKAICMVLVVIGHYIPDNAPDWYVMNREFIYSFHMPLFMFASGYIYIAFKKDESYGHFIMKKVRRLMIPYFVTSIIVITIKLITERNAYVENPVTVLSYIKALYSPEAGYFLWFIWALWWMFVITPFLKTKRLRLLGFLVAIALHFVPIAFTEIFCLEQSRKMMVYFFLGLIAYDYRQMYLGYAKRLALPIFMLFAGVEYVKLSKVSGGGGIIDFAPYLGIATVMYVSTWLSKNNALIISKILCGIAPSTYIIYLFHTTFEGFTKAILHRVSIVSGTSNEFLFFLTAIIVVSIGIIGPILLHKYVLRRFRITRTMFGLK
jgi:fucose 4-O-acetylase-like acetyltransferase